jgi:hypothetical protein
MQAKIQQLEAISVDSVPTTLDRHRDAYKD